MPVWSSLKQQYGTLLDAIKLHNLWISYRVSDSKRCHIDIKSNVKRPLCSKPVFLTRPHTSHEKYQTYLGLCLVFLNSIIKTLQTSGIHVTYFFVSEYEGLMQRKTPDKLPSFWTRLSHECYLWYCTFWNTFSSLYCLKIFLGNFESNVYVYANNVNTNIKNTWARIKAMCVFLN